MQIKFIQKRKLIKKLTYLKKSRLVVSQKSAIGFATLSLEIVKTSAGEDSEIYKTMKHFFYDQSAAAMNKQIVAFDELVMVRLKQYGEQYDSLLDACIERIKTFGVYTPKVDTKNYFGSWTNKEMVYFLAALIVGSFLVGREYEKQNVKRFFNLDAKIMSPPNKQGYKPSLPNNRSPSGPIRKVALILALQNRVTEVLLP